MLYLRIIKAIALLYFLPFHLSCQLWISSEFRPRIEYRDGYRVLPESNGGPSCLASFRTRLDISCRLSKFSFNLLPQDTRSINGGRYLESTGLNTPNTGLNLREAWVSFSPDDSYTLKIGRQEAYLNDQRLMAKRNWSQDGIGYDMIRFDIHKKTLNSKQDFHIIYSRINPLVLIIPMQNTKHSASSTLKKIMQTNWNWHSYLC